MPRTAVKPFQTNVSSRFGAPMGRTSDRLEDFSGTIYLQKIPMVDGDYDEGGAYWGGGGEGIYCAWDEDGHAYYFRAKNQQTAKKKLPPSWTYASKSKTGNSVYAEEMLQQYMETALWSTNDESDESGGEPLNKNFSVDDFSRETKKKMLADCQAFYNQNHDLLEDPEHGWPADTAGHEFWLNRNGHGTGFWDSKYGTDEAREALSEAANRFGEVNLYVTRKKIYQG